MDVERNASDSPQGLKSKEAESGLRDSVNRLADAPSNGIRLASERCYLFGATNELVSPC